MENSKAKAKKVRIAETERRRSWKKARRERTAKRIKEEETTKEKYNGSKRSSRRIRNLWWERRSSKEVDAKTIL